MKHTQVALIVGVGPGLGASLGRRFARAGMHVALAARNGAKLDALATECSADGHKGRAYSCDTTSEEDVEALFRNVAAELGEPEVVIYNAGTWARKSILDTDAAEFERHWRVGCLGGFLVGRAAARVMMRRAEGGGTGGTILFTGATASLRGGAQFHSFAAGKFALRALAQSMARELQPRGIHVAHVVIDGQIGSRSSQPAEQRGRDDRLDPDAIAEAYYQTHCQPRNAWTLELDLRPWVEKF